jgi:hypothetical protein
MDYREMRSGRKGEPEAEADPEAEAEADPEIKGPAK